MARGLALFFGRWSLECGGDAPLSKAAAWPPHSKPCRDARGDAQGRELALIKQKLFTWGATYEIWRDGALAAVVKKELFTFFHCTSTVDVPGPDDLKASGNLTDHEYTFERGERPVALVSKQLFTWSNTYGVDVSDGEDDVLILASTVVIDMVCHGSGRH